MRTLPLLSCGWHGWLGAIVIALAAVAPARAVDLSGSYVDGGTAVTSGVGRTLAEPSLYALLSLEFDPAMVKVLRERTSHVTIAHTAGEMNLEVFDENGTVSWSVRWIEEEGYVERGERVFLRFPAPREEKDEIIVVLERVEPHGLLQVSVQRVTPTLLGPVSEKPEVYLFHRMP